MAPAGGGKRKRGDRTWSGDNSHDGQRPSPHRPGNLHLAQNNQGQPSNYGRDQSENRGRGARRPSRGGRGTVNPQSPTTNRNSMNIPVSKPTSPVQRPTDAQPTHQSNGVLSTTTKMDAAIPPSSDTIAEPRPFDYSYITEEIREQWDSSGSLSVTEKGRELRDNGDYVELGMLFQELLFAGMSGRIPPAEAGAVVRNIAWPGQSASDTEKNTGTEISAKLSDVQLVFLDTISVFVAETPVSPQAFSAVVQSSGIPPALLRQELDVKFLEKMGLIRTTFGRTAVRKTTNLLYRQANFNLLREESEGFAKLMTELFTTSGNEPPTAEVVEDTVERVKAMIGSFDLDVGRALDVVLDVFGAVLVKQFRFFVKFLRASPWWPREEDHRHGRNDITRLGGLPQWALPGFTAWHLDDSQRADLLKLTEERDRVFWARARDVGLQAFYEIGREQVANVETKNALPRVTTESAEPSAKEKFMQDWVKQTGTSPPGGNVDAAQLLGFKLRFYSSSVARTESDTLPDNLIYLSALLIKVGFISLKDLYNHIWRADEDMEALRQERIKEKAERERASRPGQGAKNALLTAGALVDDTLPMPPRLRDSATRAGTPSKDPESDKVGSSTEKKDALPEPADQKIPLLKSLLAIGAIPESLFILGKFPWIVDLYPELPEYINRIIHHSLSKIYGTIKPTASDSTLQHQKPSSEPDIVGLPKGQIRLTQAPPRKVLRWALLDRDDSGTDSLDYRFYWDEWSDSIPVCQTVDDLFTLCDTFLNLTGIKIGQDPALLVKFARIGKHSIAEDKSESNLERWSELCKRLLVPALSLTKSNPGVVNEVFELLSNFSIETRYLIYQEWSGGRTSKTPDMKTAADQAKAETRDTLKRLSRTNVRPMARALAKIAYSNPHIVINTAISQIEVYDNLAEVFVEGARYFTDLGYDVLTWSLISALGRAGRSRVQESGLVTSRWLTALAYFAGKMFKRYNIMRPGPVLQYVTDQLIKGNPTDLIVLEQIILFMAGIVTDASYNDTQLLAMGGGELLRSQTILQLLDKRHESRLTSRRLMRSLKESDLAGKLLLAIAIQRQASVFNLEDANAPLKLLGNLYDEIQRVLTQYLDLLHSNLSPEEYESAVPDVAQLIVSYKVQPEVAFWISRPNLSRRIAEYDKAMHVNGAQKKNEDLIPKDLEQGDVDMADQIDGAGEDEGEALETEPVMESAATPTAAEINGVDSNPESPTKPAGEEVSISEEHDQQWHPVLQPIMDSIRPSLPGEVSNVIGLGFYVTFWQLALYDVTIPGKSYEDELSRQHKRIATISSNRADVTALGARKREADKKQISNLIDRILTENKEHLKAFAESKARLSKEKNNWFVGTHGKSEMLNSALMEHCFLPRILLSPLDSLFSFKFLKFLHTSGTSNFRTMGFYDLIFRQNRLTSLIFMCTSKEADNLGRFLHEILRDLARWHRDRNMYEREAWGSKMTLPGFAKKVSSTGKPESFLHYEDFRRLLYKWHQHLAIALQTCLSSTEYMHIRNAISVLKAVAENFPAITFHGAQLQKLVSALGESDQGDIKVPSLSLMADLIKAQKSWILPQAFRKGQEKPLVNSAIPPGTSTPGPAAQSLNAEAGEFKPSSSSGADQNFVQKPVIEVNADHHEIKETQMTDVGPTAAGSTNSSRGEIKDETTELPTVPRVEPETGAEIPTVSETVTQDLRLSGSSTPLSAKIPSSEMRQQDGNNEASTQQSRTMPQRPDPTSGPLQPHPNLPHRPERTEPRHIRPSDARIPSRPPPHVDSPRDQRDNRSHERPSSGRYGENHSDAAEHPPQHSRPHERRPERFDSGPERGDRPRSQERNAGPRYPPQDRRNQPSFRENGTSGWQSERSGHVRPPADSPRNKSEHERRQQERPPRDHHMGPPRGPQSANTEAANINPERAALITGSAGSRNGISIRGQGEDKLDRGSRPTSPKGDHDSRHPARRERADDRQEQFDRRSADFDPRHRDRHDSSFGGGPRAPHSDRPNRSGDSFPRDVRYQPPQQYVEVDMNHGRLNQDNAPPARHHEQASDRSEHSNDVPSGPRDRNPPSTSRGRNAHPVQAQPVPQHSPSNHVQSSMGAPDRPAPTGPASRSHTRGQAFQEQQTTSNPSTPADTSGVHPDRLALVSLSAEGPPPRTQSYSSKPSSAQTSPTSVPSGPRGSAPSGAPSGPAPIIRGPPSGPQGNGRNNRHPLAAVNNTLQQAGQGQNIRGRGGSRMSNGPPMPHSGPPTPTAGPGQGPRSEVTIPPLQDQGRADLFSRADQDVNGRRLPSQRRDDLAPERPPPSGRRGDLMDEASESRRGSSRHSGSSRTHSPDGDGTGRRNERGQGSHRDRETYRSERDGDGRDYHGRDRVGGDLGRDRRGGGEGEDRPPREPSSRQQRDDAQNSHPPPQAPQRRSTRRDPASSDLPSNSIPPPHGPSAQGPPPPPYDDRGRRRGYQSGPGPGAGPSTRGDERDHQQRGGGWGGGDRDMRDRESRAPPARDLRGPDPGLRDGNDLPPRKHPRAEEGGPYGGGGRGGNRMASESKRPRRGV